MVQLDDSVAMPPKRKWAHVLSMIGMPVMIITSILLAITPFFILWKVLSCKGLPCQTCRCISQSTVQIRRTSLGNCWVFSLTELSSTQISLWLKNTNKIINKMIVFILCFNVDCQINHRRVSSLMRYRRHQVYCFYVFLSIVASIDYCSLAIIAKTNPVECWVHPDSTNPFVDCKLRPSCTCPQRRTSKQSQASWLLFNFFLFSLQQSSSPSIVAIACSCKHCWDQ